MTAHVASVLSEVVRLAPTLHKAGTFSATTLEALVRHASMARVSNSAETGSGASTLLFSHLSAVHTVFAMDGGTGSVRAIQESPLLKPGTVTFVDGPTQRTLPPHKFDAPLQLVLIDGPHAFPFPELEYYYLYPHLESGALLIVDDIHIPTITNLFDFLAAEDMFQLEEVVETTAFFRRTAAPTFDTMSDGWWHQRYNRRGFEPVLAAVLSEEPPARQDVPADFHLEQFGPCQNPTGLDTIRIVSGADVVVSGWALDRQGRRPATAVDLVVDGHIYRVKPHVARGDVATAFGSFDYFRSGFSAALPTALLGPGNHVLDLRIVTHGGRLYSPAMIVRFEVA